MLKQEDTGQGPRERPRRGKRGNKTRKREERGKGRAYVLIHEGFDVEGLHDVAVELRMQVRVPYPLVQQLPHLALPLSM